MKKCPNCARAYSDMVTVCPVCKTSLSGGAAPRPAPQPTRPTPPPVQQTPPAQTQPQRPVTPTYTPPQQTTTTYQPAARSTPAANTYYTNYDDDKAGLGWIILSFLLPIVGIILNFRWKHDRPKAAKAVSAAAIAGILLGVFMSTMSGGIGDLIPAKQVKLAPSNPEAYNKIFSDRYIVESPVSFRGLESASYAIAYDNGYVESRHFGYDGDTVAAIAETMYLALPAGAPADKAYYDEYVLSELPAFDHLPFVSASSYLSQNYYSMTITITGLDNETTLRQAVSSGLVPISDSSATYLSISATEESLLASGYVKK